MIFNFFKIKTTLQYFFLLKLARELADYLTFLDRNSTAYMRYFEWRRSVEGLTSLPRIHNSWCKLCSMLNNDSLPIHFYSDINSWWFNEQCE